jgi:hypothetical protein
MVVLEADPGVARDLARLDVRVRGGLEGTLEDAYVQEVPVAGLPVLLGLVPLGRDARRRIAVELEGLSATRERLGVVRAETRFVAGRTVELRLRLEDCCRATTCPDDQTCRACACLPDDVDGSLLPDFGVDAATIPDAGPIDAPPDAWTAPVVGEGSPCDLAAIANVCAPGTACTCTGARGCTGAEPPRCWAMRDIGCGRPIDLSERMRREGTVRVSGDGAGAPEIVPGTCIAASSEVAYVLRNDGAETISVGLQASVGMEYWDERCDTALTWGSCRGGWTLPLAPGRMVIVLLEASGPYVFQVDML